MPKPNFIRINRVEMSPSLGGPEGDQEGYNITYPDGYQSWCPKEAADKCSYEEGSKEFMLLNGCLKAIEKSKQA